MSNDTERWSSWFKAPVLKTGVRVTVPRVRIPVSPPFFYRKILRFSKLSIFLFFYEYNYYVDMEKYSSGRRGAPAKGVGRVTGARVQIPLSPP
jgi:hypothetical protein